MLSFWRPFPASAQHDPPVVWWASGQDRHFPDAGTEGCAGLLGGPLLQPPSVLLLWCDRREGKAGTALVLALRTALDCWRPLAATAHHDMPVVWRALEQDRRFPDAGTESYAGLLAPHSCQCPAPAHLSCGVTGVVARQTLL